VAALVGMFTSKKFGRRFTMICAGAAFIIGEQQPGVDCGQPLTRLPTGKGCQQGLTGCVHTRLSALVTVQLPHQNLHYAEHASILARVQLQAYLLQCSAAQDPLTVGF
jgi:hypothetical protein